LWPVPSRRRARSPRSGITRTRISSRPSTGCQWRLRPRVTLFFRVAVVIMARSSFMEMGRAKVRICEGPGSVLSRPAETSRRSRWLGRYPGRAGSVSTFSGGPLRSSDGALLHAATGSSAQRFTNRMTLDQRSPSRRIRWTKNNRSYSSSSRGQAGNGSIASGARYSISSNRYWCMAWREPFRNRRNVRSATICSGEGSSFEISGSNCELLPPQARTAARRAVAKARTGPPGGDRSRPTGLAPAGTSQSRPPVEARRASCRRPIVAACDE